MVFIDSNIFFDMWDHDPVWEQWSKAQFLNISLVEQTVINPIIFAELAPRFNHPGTLKQILDSLELTILDIPLDAAFVAGKTHALYRQQGGNKAGVLPDFLIGAHAQAEGASVLTRDPSRYRTYFPSVGLITP